MTQPVDSLTVQINSIAQQKIAAGIPVFNLSAGEPKLPPHPLIVAAAIEALQQGKTFYPPVAGIPELRTMAAKWMNQEYDAEFNTEHCLVTNGGKFGIYLLLQLLLEKEDEVIVAAPYWVSYPAITTLFGGKTKILETKPSNHWKINIAELENLDTTRCKFLMLNSGCNPTGTIYTHSELAAILSFAEERDLFVISDEVYSGLTYDHNEYVSCAKFKAFQDRIAIVQSCSKNLSMTGWRIGFVFAQPDLIKSLTALMSQSTSGVATISQWTALEGLAHFGEINAWIKTNMEKRRNALIAALQEFFKLKVTPPSSSLYLFVALKDLGITYHSAVDFCKQALEKANVAMVPGEAFGQPGYIRMSFGAEEEDLKNGVKALTEFCSAQNIGNQQSHN